MRKQMQNGAMKQWAMCFILLMSLQLSFPPNLSAQTVELNVKVRSGTASESFLRLGDPTFRIAGASHLNNSTHIAPLANTSRSSSARSLDQLYTIAFSATSAKSQAEALLATGQFEWVEENRVIKVHAAEPNDPGVADQYYHPLIRTFEAWDSTKGNSDVVVGILDTGLDYGHPEFEGQVAVNSAEDINGNGTFEPWPDTTMVGGVSGDFDGLDNDNNGFADDVIGYDFTDQPRSPFGGDYLFEDADPLDDNNHGTLVAGIIAAKADNNYGGAGIAPGCRLKVLRCFGSNGGGEDDDIARAIIYAADNDIRILNFSFGDIYPSQMMHAAIRYAAAKGVVMLASAGNGTGDNLHYPSSFDEVISVSASSVSSTGNESLWPLSSFGHSVSLCAPGSGIYTTIVRDTSNEADFDFFSGTSTSAPMVTAAVALLFSQRGPCTPQQIRGILTSTADDIGQPGWDHFTGAGRLNIEQALQAPGASNVQILSPGNDGGSASDSVYVIGTMLDPQFREAVLEYQPGIEGDDTWVPIREGISAQILADTLGLWVVSGLADGEYTLRLRVEKTNGSTAEDRVRFVVDRSPPLVEVRVAAPAWDNFERAILIVFRSDDRGVTRLHFRPNGTSDWSQMTLDRTTRNGHFLLNADVLSAATYEYYLETTNEAGLAGSSTPDFFQFTPAFLNLSGYDTLGYDIPMGHYLSTPTDFDNDGLQEVVMSEYNSRLGFGKLKFYEYNAGEFTVADSIDIKPILIPKDVRDIDGDGKMDLLCSVNDSIYVIEPAAPGEYPSVTTYTNFDNGLFAARFADTENNGRPGILAKDFVDYHFLAQDGNGGFSTPIALPDQSPDYQGSVAPRALLADFDQDGQQDIIYGDFDGDFLVFEFDGTNYTNTFTDSTQLTKSGSYLTQGDFDGDGIPEFFVATHPSLNRNEVDFEYEAPYWHLRIFKTVGDNQYAVQWEDYLYDIDTDDYNAATAGNIDQDNADELIFTTFPRTFIIEWELTQYRVTWFHFGDLATHHVIGDFNGNGVNEFALGRGDKALFWEKDFNYAGPQPLSSLRGTVVDSTVNSLTWEPVSSGNDYLIWRGEVNGNGSVLISLIDSVSNFGYLDSNLVVNQPYLYVITVKNTSLNPVYSDFSNAVLLQPHALGRVDSAIAINARQVRLLFNVPIDAQPEDKPLFKLNGAAFPTAIISSGDNNYSLLLEFAEDFNPGSNQIEISGRFRDALAAAIAPASRTVSFVYQPDTALVAYFTRWETLSNSEARIAFNFPMESSVLDPGLYKLLPSGRVTAVEWDDAAHTAIRVRVEDAAFGALGYPVSVILQGGSAQNGAPMADKEGNVATFSDFKPDLTGVYVYPNPFQRHEEFDGVRFANLTQMATVHVYDVTGGKVITLQETNGDGGLEWNLIDVWGKRVRPGVYMFQVISPDGEETVGSFSLLE